MKITIINLDRNEKRYTRVELDEFVTQLRDGTYRQQYIRDFTKEVCFAAEWAKQNGERLRVGELRSGMLKAKSINSLVLLSLENLRNLSTVEEYKRLAILQPYTLLCFMGHDGHSLHIVCPYTVSDGNPSETALLNAFRKLHYIYSSQLGTPLAEHEPTFETSCKASYDPQPFYNPTAIAIVVSSQPEDSPAFKSIQEDISDYNYPEEIPGLSLRNSRMRRFHDCLDAIIEKQSDLRNDEEFAIIVLEQLADGCRIMGLPQVWCARVASFIPMFSDCLDSNAIESVFKTAYLKETQKHIPMKFTRPSALLAFKTEAYMKEHYTLRLNVMTGTPEYRMK